MVGENWQDNMEYEKLTYFGCPIYDFSDFERQNGMVPLNFLLLKPSGYIITSYSRQLKNWQDKMEYENLTYFGWVPLLSPFLYKCSLNFQVLPQLILIQDSTHLPQHSTCICLTVAEIPQITVYFSIFTRHHLLQSALFCKCGWFVVYLPLLVMYIAGLLSNIIRGACSRTTY